MGKREKVIVAMSGGVDSSYAAWLLLRQGYEVEGLCLDLFEDSKVPAEAAEAGRMLGIRVYTEEKRQLFRREVIDCFCRSYLAGQTPNPCTLCNPRVKFALLLAAAQARGADKIATGHYVRCVSRRDTDSRALLRGLDRKKDQSYFLYRLTQEILRKTVFPLGELTKDAVRAGAAAAGLPAAQKRDSQEICFIPDGDYQSFLRKERERIAEPADAGRGEKGFLPGDFIGESGQVLGRHKGLAFYTVGQRKKLGAAFGRPMFVLALRPEENRIVIGPEESLYAREVRISADYFIGGKRPDGPLRLLAKLRSGAKPAPAYYCPRGEKEALLVFEEAQLAVTPGQSAVYYLGDLVLGGGIIAGKR